MEPHAFRTETEWKGAGLEDTQGIGADLSAIRRKSDTRRIQQRSNVVTRQVWQVGG